MLTGNLVRVRTSKAAGHPAVPESRDPQWLEVAESLLLIFREGVGMTRGEIEAEIDEMFGDGPKATLAHRGLAKVPRRPRRVRGGGRRPARGDPREGLLGRRRARRGSRAEGRGASREPVPPRRGPRRRRRASWASSPSRSPPSLFADLKDENRLLTFDDMSAQRLDRPLQRGAGAGGPAPLGPGRRPRSAARSPRGIASSSAGSSSTACSTASRGPWPTATRSTSTAP